MIQKSKILLVDDEVESCQALSHLLTQTGYSVETSASGEEALELLKKQPFDLIISDLCLPGISGIDIIKHTKDDCSEIGVILITGKASAETAVEAMKEGALDYITKPFNFERLKVQVTKALEKNRLVLENKYLRQQLLGRYHFDNIIGTSQAMQQVFSRMGKVAGTDSTILILGASGTGKELVAKAIHYNSPRKNKPFLAINCGAIPADLLESELFGHVKGAFTSAFTDKLGKFEVANGGTIFLDEIGNMPQQLQVKLLRVLQEHEFEPVGSTRKTHLNIRLISATNIDLEKQVKAGQFREDLYYRLNVIPIHLPPLKDRHGDIPQLARFFADKICKEMNLPQIKIDADAIQAMEVYDWPGNVREMENIIERTIALTDSLIIRCEDLPSNISQSLPKAPTGVPQITTKGINMNQAIAEIETEMIKQALSLGQGVKARAANLLKINRTTLVEKIKRLGIEN
ncbi:two component, sigma54 specific, transcriptional regulator, Fis family [Desulfuromusa kysingii]|uniref:Two component, sigma54 specific, transcriptional regulator, Fis family n=1 Tax=Desulfuromusa kysingii TaxID=37625 RepID=A0A1H3YIM0_9BACT|nr:sigma-54 dependent transcriptional regulator [Desulfuromusa kysingii]SEA11406.1 two component, sigma54 specific, transcriptional regulator, Fis family [Desulfuromusa kysingii]